MGNGFKILIAEDEPVLAFPIQFALERAGCTVAVAGDGREAWDLLQQHAFDLLITDDQMPKMTGSELCLRIRQTPHLAQLPVIMLTGKASEMKPDWLPHRLDGGEVIPKPFSPRKLVGIVMNRLLAPSESVPTSVLQE